MTEPIRVRKRPVEAQAIHWTGDNLGAVYDFIDDDDKVHFWQSPGGGLALETAKSGALPVYLGDWILRDDTGTYPCRADVFDAAYELV